MKDLKVGDKIRIGALETEIEGFSKIAGQQMVSADYGDFNYDAIQRI